MVCAFWLDHRHYAAGVCKNPIREIVGSVWFVYGSTLWRNGRCMRSHLLLLPPLEQMGYLQRFRYVHDGRVGANDYCVGHHGRKRLGFTVRDLLSLVHFVWILFENTLFIQS